MAAGCAPGIRTIPVETRQNAAQPASPILQIGIVPKARRLTLEPEGAYSMIDADTNDPQLLENGRAYEVQALGDEVYTVGERRLRGTVRLSPEEPEAVVRIGNKTYRGSLVIKPNSDSTVAVINELGIEEYLDGVLPAEMSPDWPLEALKAQAVVARTFALNNLGKFQSSGFDLSSDSRSQAYEGMGRESASVRSAVRATAGLVLSWHGRLLPVFFHACCGGHTDDYRNVWGSGSSPKPLHGVSDRWCRTSPEYRWSAVFDQDDILEALSRHGRRAIRLKKIRPDGRDSGGFVRELRFYAKPKTFEVPAKDFRDWMGSASFKSVKIDGIYKKGRGFEFRGRGFGHGVGMCQSGARLMAQRHKSYRQILDHYFPGAHLARYNE